MTLRRRLRGSPRRLAAAGGVMALLVAAAACSSGGSGSAGSSASSGKVNLTYAMWQTPEQAGYQKSIDQFEKAHPNIHVTIESFAYNDYQPKLTTEFSSSGGPDVYWVNTPMIASWLKDGVMENLSSNIQSANVNLNQYLSTLVALHKYNGDLYGLPKDWDTIAYFYNADYFTAHHITVPSNLSWNPTNGGTWLTFLKGSPTTPAATTPSRRTSTQAPSRPMARTPRTRCSGALTPTWPMTASSSSASRTPTASPSTRPLEYRPSSSSPT